MNREQIIAKAHQRIDEIAADAMQSQRRGMWTLFSREIQRFMTVAGQTIVSPVLTTMLYFLVFGYSLGERLQDIQGVAYIDFLVPGLILLALVNNAYINAAFSLFISKIHGMIVDLLVTPISPLQFLFAYVAAAMVRAMLIGGCIWIVALLMGAALPLNAPLAVVFMLLTSYTFAMLGLCMAIVSDEFDQVNLLPSFLITPLTFLGGVFYAVEMLPPFWRQVSYFNPVLHMVSGLRYSMTGVGDTPWWSGLLVLTVMAVTCTWIARRLLINGTKLRE